METESSDDKQQPEILDGGSYDDRCFRGLPANGTEIVNAEFYECRFESCRFFQSTFRQCGFERCTFKQCDLSVVELDESSLHDVRFLDSKLLGTDWSHAKKPISIAFQRCNISQSVFARLSLQRTEIVECTAHEVDFSGTNLTRTKLCGTDLARSRFADTNLSHADFTGAQNYSIDPNNNRLKKTVFDLPEALSLLSAFDIVLK